MGTRNREVAVRLVGPWIVLGDLRWLIDELVNLPDESPVSVTGHYDYDGRDSDPETIVVTGKAVIQS